MYNPEQNKTNFNMAISKRKLKIFFYSVDATGHINSAVGMAQELQNRGHEILFFTNSVISKSISKHNIPVYELIFTEPELESIECPAKEYAKIFKDAGGLTGNPSIKKLHLWSDLSEGSLMRKCLLQCNDFHPQIESVIAQNKPDCFIMDHVLFQPFIAKYKIPWVAIMSVAPTFLYQGPDLSPAMSGYTVEERNKWDEFVVELDKVSEAYETCQNEFNEHFGYVPKADDYKRKVFYNISPYLSLYQYPQELDYLECEPRFPNLARVDAFIRNDDTEFQIPEQVQPNRDAGERLLFLSMGSMGGIDLELMRKLIASLSKIKHKVIVSKGLLGDELELADNMWGENFLPQTKILPLVDLVLTHGGNNSITESFYFGKPMVVMPLFADQYDNAQRIQDKGYGIRLEPYNDGDAELHSAIESLLSNNKLTEDLKIMSHRIQNSNSKQIACERIEQLFD